MTTTFTKYTNKNGHMAWMADDFSGRSIVRMRSVIDGKFYYQIEAMSFSGHSRPVADFSTLKEAKISICKVGA